MWDLIIKNGTIVNYDGQYKATLYIKDKKIAAISSEPSTDHAENIIDAEGKYILPGLIDTHVHSRDGGATHKEDFFHSTMSAAAGGITTVFEMPNTFPAVSNEENFNIQKANLGSKANVNFGMWAICLGRLNLSDIQKLNELGVIGYKYFWGYAINKKNNQLVYNYDESMTDIIPPCNDGEVYEMLEEVAKTNKLFAVHAENSDLINTLTAKYKNDQNDYEGMLKARPHLAEETTVQTGIAMAEATNARLHILHISSGGTLDIIDTAQKKGIQVTGETCPHYLFLTNEDFKKHGSMMKVYPPVKYQRDQDKLWEGIQNGLISLVCSDHAPHLLEDKLQNIWEASAGMCGVQSMASLMLDAVHQGRITIEKFVEVLSYNPAKLFGLEKQKGKIQIDSDADITIVDLDAPFTIKTEELHSVSKVTAFAGYKGVGKPIYTIVNGNIVMKDGEIIQTHKGEFIKS